MPKTEYTDEQREVAVAPRRRRQHLDRDGYSSEARVFNNRQIVREAFGLDWPATPGAVAVNEYLQRFKTEWQSVRECLCIPNELLNQPVDPNRG
jgi:hypothetical protein